MSMVDPLTPAELLAVRALLAPPPAPPPTPGPLAATPVGFVADVAAGQVISSATYGNPIRDASTMRFATVADRDLYWPAASAPLGALCVTVDTGALWELNDRTGARRWTPPWSTAWGRVGFATYSGDFAFTAQVDVPGLTVTFNMVQGRSYRYDVNVNTYATATGVFSLLICDVANGQLQVIPLLAATGQSVQANSFAVFEPGTVNASVVRKVRALVPGAYTGHIYAATGYTATFAVSDAGPSTPITP